MNRAEVLEAAAKCVCGQREQDHGRMEDNFQAIADFWNVYLDRAHPELNLKNVAYHIGVSAIITPEDVAVMMGLLKIARIATGSSPDSFVDLAGYAACAGEIATRAAKPVPKEEIERALNSLQTTVSRLGEHLYRSRLELEDDGK